MNETPHAVFIALLDDMQHVVFRGGEAQFGKAVDAWRRQWLDRYDEAENGL